jgi:iron complex outermembrane receptor protein
LSATALVATFLGSAVAAQAQTAAPAAPGAQVQEVIVTAQRRSERLQDVPMTVVAVSSQQLEQRGVTETAGLQRLTGGLQMPMYGAWISPSIRGVSTAITNSGVSSNVAFYLDGVYQPTQIGQLMDLPDVQEIEILKGPQGTLYGQNAEGGAIVINTVSPSFTPTGKLSAAYGNLNDKQLRGYVTGPLVGDTLAGSLAASWEQRDGYDRGIIDNRRDEGLEQALIRGKLLFKPTDAAKVTLTGYWTRRTDSSPFDGQLFQGLGIVARTNPSTVAASGPWITTVQPETSTSIRSWGFNLRGQFDVDVGELDMISAYSNNRSLVSSQPDYSPVNMFFSQPLVRNHAFVEEVNFVSKKFWGATVTAGLFYQNSFESLDPNIFVVYDSALGLPATIYPNPPQVSYIAQYGLTPATNEFYSGYLEASYDVTDKIVVSAGGRYTRQTMHGYNTLDSRVSKPVELLHSPASWTNFSPRFTARYKLTGDSNVYFTYAKGFKAGLVNTSDPTGLPVNPEKLTSYEVGYKGTLFDRLQVNVSGFLYDYTDKQVAYYDPPNFPAQNAAAARIKGIDVDFHLAVTPELTLSGSGEFLDAKYKNYPGAAVYVLDPATGGLMNVKMDLGGHTMDRAPKFSGSFSGDYHLDLEPGRFNVHASVYHSGRVLWDPNGLVYQKPYSLVDAEVGFAPEAVKGLRIVAYGKNLTNAAYLESYLETTFAAGVSYSPPRQYGVRVEYQF